MKLSLSLTHGALALLMAAGAAVQARADERVLTFADPNSPGKIVIQMGFGDLHIVGADVKEVTVLSSEDLGGSEADRDDGLRRLDSGDSHSVTNTGNTIQIVSSGLFGGHRGGEGSDLELTVPASTVVVVQRAGPGDTRIENVAGDIEVRTAIGDLDLSGISGGAVIEAAHGDVRAVFASFPTDRPVSISTAHGDVEVHVPEQSRAKVRFRTLRGEILTDFSKDQLDTKMEQAETVQHEDSEGDRDTKALARRERDRARAEAVLAREQAREAERAAKEAAEHARRSAAEGGYETVVPPIPPVPPIPAMPPLAGGKVVAGQLNGGGADLSITALMGDILFRKAQ